jgi:nucleoside-diphosphate-sugar epimerase
MYADDLVIWLMNIIDDSQYESEYYNVGSDQPFEIREIARKLDQIFGVENQYNKVDNNIDIYVPDTSKIKRKFRIMNAYDIDSSLNETIKKIKKYQIIERFYK